MIPTQFKIAMFTQGGVGPFKTLGETWMDQSNEWLIIERRGKSLWISDGNIPAEHTDRMAGRAAPVGLSENTSLAAIHVATQADGQAAQFLLSGFAVPSDHAPGHVLSVSGVVWLRMRAGRLSLEAQGYDMMPILCDAGAGGEWGAADGAGLSARQTRWTLRATGRPWSTSGPSLRSRSGRSEDPRSEPFVL